MSEYQCYEFIAVDNALTPKQMRELRAISTRAEISPTRFWNEYQWGDLKADPRALLAKYFDVHYYFANWGKHVLMLRLPKTRCDVRALKPYFDGGHASAISKEGRFVVLEFWSDEDEPPDEEPSDAGRLAELLPIRGQLLQGDLRAPYLGWLAGIGRGAEDDDIEPTPPAGLTRLGGPLEALVNLLGISRALVAAAAEGSEAPTLDSSAAREWLSHQSPNSKEKLLLRAMQNPDLSVGAELLMSFRKSLPAPTRRRRRTVEELRKRASELAGRDSLDDGEDR